MVELDQSLEPVKSTSFWIGSNFLIVFQTRLIKTLCIQTWISLALLLLFLSQSNSLSRRGKSETLSTLQHSFEVRRSTSKGRISEVSRFPPWPLHTCKIPFFRLFIRHSPSQSKFLNLENRIIFVREFYICICN
jgi:hypothetical protein